MDDLLIRGGDVIDGTNAPARRLDVAVRGERIVAIEPSRSVPARRVIDARGHVVAPGFIDIKTHSDFTLPLYPRAESRVHQGITTELVGSCGFTAAPIPRGRLTAVSDYLAPLAPALPLRETTFAEYLDSFPASAVNVAMQVGHNTLRVAVMGLENRVPTSDESAAMERLIEEALEAGAEGISSGPFTAPDAFAQSIELEQVAHLAARRGASYATHLRDESIKVFDALQEAITVADRTGGRTRIVHIKLSGTDNWGGAHRFLDEVATARARDVQIDCDHYPYLTATSALRNLLPVWIQEGGADRMLLRLADPIIRHDIRAEITEHGLRGFGRIPSWDSVRVSMSSATPGAVGHTIARLSAKRGCDPVDELCRILLADQGRTRGLVDAMDETDVRTFVACPWVLIGSDGRAFGDGGPLAQDLPHPRFYGTYARILGHYVRELKLLTLPEAIHKMTGGPASALGLTDRGTLRVGAAADITVFDPDKIAERATFDEPRRYPDGVVHVIVNGVGVIDNFAHTGMLPGRVLRRNGSVVE